MDEATSAMDVPLEASCMQRCIDRGIGIISVGHRPTLLPFHTHVLTMEGHGKYTLRPMPHQAGNNDSEQHGESESVASASEVRSADASSDVLLRASGRNSNSPNRLGTSRMIVSRR